MEVQINTDRNIKSSALDIESIEGEIKTELGLFASRLTQVIVHLSDENAQKSGPKDKRCTIEARPSGLKPLAVNHSSDSLRSAITGATEKLSRLLKTTLEKLDRH